MNWNLAKTQPNRYFRDGLILSENGILAYLPQTLERKRVRHRRRPIEICRPLLGGYFFIADADIFQVKNILPNIQFVYCANNAVIARDEDIDQVQKLEERSNRIFSNLKRPEIMLEIGTRVWVNDLFGHGTVTEPGIRLTKILLDTGISLRIDPVFLLKEPLQ